MTLILRVVLTCFLHPLPYPVVPYLVGKEFTRLGFASSLDNHLRKDDAVLRRNPRLVFVDTRVMGLVGAEGSAREMRCPRRSFDTPRG